MKPVLKENLFDVPEMTVVIATIRDKRETSALLKFLKSQNFDLPPHLKIFRSKSGCLDIALCRPEQLAIFKECLIVSDVKDVLTDFREISVAARVPQLRSQFDKVNALWPVAFHRNKRLSALIDGTYFSGCFLNFLDEIFVKEIVSRCRRENILLSQLISCPNLLTVMINEREMEVIEVSCNSGLDGDYPAHPLGHSVMVCVEAIARMQRQSSVKSEIATAAKNLSASVSQSAPTAQSTQTLSERSFESGGYLCTGLVALLTHEPCAMCCMTLLHSRIASVIYSIPFEKGGYIGSVQLIHDDSNFNHRFNVFKDFHGKELQDILEKCQQSGS